MGLENADNQFYDLSYLSERRLLFSLTVTEFDYNSAEETDLFWYSSSGYEIIDLYLDVSSISAKHLLSVFIRKGYEFLLINGDGIDGELTYETFKQVMEYTNSRLLQNFFMGLNFDTLSKIIEDMWDKHENNMIDPSKVIKHKKFLFKPIKDEKYLSLEVIRRAVITFFNNKRKGVANDKKVELEAFVHSTIDSIDGFLSYERMAEEIDVKTPTVKSYCNELGLTSIIKEYNKKHFFSTRVDNYTTHQDINEAGTIIHFDEQEIITQSKVSEKVDKSLITMVRNWQPHRDKFNKLNQILKNK